MTKQLKSEQLAEDYISAHLPFKGRSASQVLQDESTLTSVKIWGKRSFLKTRLRCAYSCLDLAHGLKNICRSTKVSDHTTVTLAQQSLKDSHKWGLWKRFFKIRRKDVMSRAENKENELSAKKRKNAGIFIPDYEEEQTVNTEVERHSLELCDLEDSGHYDMSADKS